jgi:phage portal protein BeeE
MNLKDRMADAWAVLRGRKSISEVGMALATWLHGGVDAVSSWQFKASKLLAEEVGSAIFRLYKIKADGTWSEIESHPVLDLLYKPNLYSTRSELFEAVSMSLDFFGNAYLFMDGADSPTAKPKSLCVENVRLS